MAYTKHTWQCGESISADLLNHMEDGIADASGGGSGDCGYECVTAYTEILNESVTTADDGYGSNWGNLSEAVYDIPQIRVTLNGTEYICEYDVDLDTYGAPYDEDLGDYDWSEYPFVVSRDALGTPNAGTYSLKIESANETAETTECFEKAVLKVAPRYIVKEVLADGSNDRILTGMTAEEMFDAFDNGASILVQQEGNGASYRIIGAYKTQGCSTSYDFIGYRYDQNLGWTMATFIANSANNFIPTLVTA